MNKQLIQKLIDLYYTRNDIESLSKLLLQIPQEMYPFTTINGNRIAFERAKNLYNKPIYDILVILSKRYVGSSSYSNNEIQSVYNDEQTLEQSDESYVTDYSDDDVDESVNNNVNESVEENVEENVNSNYIDPVTREYIPNNRLYLLKEGNHEHFFDVWTLKRIVRIALNENKDPINPVTRTVIPMNTVFDILQASPPLNDENLENEQQGIIDEENERREMIDSDREFSQRIVEHFSWNIPLNNPETIEGIPLNMIFPNARALQPNLNFFNRMNNRIN